MASIPKQRKKRSDDTCSVDYYNGNLSSRYISTPERLSEKFSKVKYKEKYLRRPFVAKKPRRCFVDPTQECLKRHSVKNDTDIRSSDGIDLKNLESSFCPYCNKPYKDFWDDSSVSSQQSDDSLEVSKVEHESKMNKGESVGRINFSCDVDSRHLLHDVKYKIISQQPREKDIFIDYDSDQISNDVPDIRLASGQSSFQSNNHLKRGIHHFPCKGKYWKRELQCDSDFSDDLCQAIYTDMSMLYSKLPLTMPGRSPTPSRKRTPLL